ncbi:hypothetical protein B0T17DRAFT_491299 [Bombardia bombarda]|uniref:Beta-xylosidase n=1 Tax=Bombardia bombarda TaxID=252184 RepID=A0AA39X799_9PEZI|nr:hypothetical protein B0T17DRAFT_491299 [Bombardia bombarda]
MENNTTSSSSSITARTLTARRAATNPAFKAKLAQMALPLAPLVQLTTGQVHPAFPSTWLNFWLLTEDQLDALAHFYHQRTPSLWSAHYPCPIVWDSALSLEDKRRKIGKFIGLRGCETPVVRAAAAAAAMTEEEIMENARRARMRRDDDEEMRRKMGWGR